MDEDFLPRITAAERLASVGNRAVPDPRYVIPGTSIVPPKSDSPDDVNAHRKQVMASRGVHGPALRPVTRLFEGDPAQSPRAHAATVGQAQGMTVEGTPGGGGLSTLWSRRQQQSRVSIDGGQ
jgi:hypothetical protein